MAEKFRVTNITHLIPGQAGFFLNFHGQLLQCGKPAIVDIDRLQKMKKNENVSVDPSLLHEWVAKGWAKLKDPDSGETIVDTNFETSAAHISPDAATPRSLAKIDNPADEFEEDFDPENAVDATLPPKNGPHAPPTNQVAGSRAKITHPGEQTPDPIGESPLPGTTAVNVDGSDKFTVKAPRTNQPGGVIKS